MRSRRWPVASHGIPLSGWSSARSASPRLHRIVVDRMDVTLRRPTLMRLHEMSGGNPLYALEIVRGLGDDAELALPDDLSALLRARLAVLSPRAGQS